MIDEVSLPNKVSTEGAINHGTVKIAPNDDSKTLFVISVSICIIKYGST